MQNDPLDNLQQLNERDERLLATFSHLGFLVTNVIPLANIVAPLVIWLTQRDKSEYVARHALEALNFQITLLILAFGAAVLILLLVGIPLLIMLAIANVVFSIVGAIKANRGEAYEYPFNFRLIK